MTTAPTPHSTTTFHHSTNTAVFQIKIAVWASLVANFCLCVLQCLSSHCSSSVFILNRAFTHVFLNEILVYAAISSGSLSLLATGIDSVFDIGSNILLFFLHRKAAKLDINKWPVGGTRLQTIGNVVYG